MRHRHILLLLALCSCGSSSVPPSLHPESHCTPGSFSTPDDRGSLTTVPRAGRVTVLELWSRHCKGCEKTLPEILARKDALAAEGIELLIVGVLEQEESIDDARATLKSWGVETAFLVDRGGTIMRKYGIEGPPAAVVLDSSGAVRWISPVGGANAGVVHAAAKQAFSTCTH